MEVCEYFAYLQKSHTQPIWYTQRTGDHSHVVCQLFDENEAKLKMSGQSKGFI